MRPAKASPFGRGVTEGDGEGKPGRKELLRSDGQALCQSDTIAVQELLGPRPAGCERQRSRRWEPQPGQWQRVSADGEVELLPLWGSCHACGVTERATVNLWKMHDRKEKNL